MKKSSHYTMPYIGYCLITIFHYIIIRYYLWYNNGHQTHSILNYELTVIVLGLIAGICLSIPIYLYIKSNAYLDKQTIRRNNLIHFLIFIILIMVGLKFIGYIDHFNIIFSPAVSVWGSLFIFTFIQSYLSDQKTFNISKPLHFVLPYMGILTMSINYTLVAKIGIYLRRILASDIIQKTYMIPLGLLLFIPIYLWLIGKQDSSYLKKTVPIHIIIFTVIIIICFKILKIGYIFLIMYSVPLGIWLGLFIISLSKRNLV